MHSVWVVKVRDIMKPARWTVGRGDTLAAAERMMVRRKLRQVFVVDSGRLAGSISEPDILACRVRTPADALWWDAPVARAMQELSTVVGPDEAVAVAAERLARCRADALPVVEGGYLVGQVTARELLDVDRAAQPPHELATAADVMADPAVMITPSDSLLVAAGLMAEHQLRHLPVIEGGVVVGMLSDRDIRTVIGDPLRFVATPERLSRVNVRDAMTGPAITVAPSTPLTELAAKFADQKIGALPVIDRERTLLGIVSYVDVLRALAVRR